MMSQKRPMPADRLRRFWDVNSGTYGHESTASSFDGIRFLRGSAPGSKNNLSRSDGIIFLRGSAPGR